MVNLKSSLELNAMFVNYLIDMHFTKRLFTIILINTCLLFIYNSCTAQTDHDLGNWNTLILKGKLSPRLSLIGEGQIRSSSYDLKYEYFEAKTAISCTLTKNLTGLFGTGFYNTYQTGGLLQTPAKQKEFRTWLELSLKQTFNRFYFDHRVRIEQRFIPENYKNRLKYRLGLMVPVNKSGMTLGSIYLTVNDELWIPQYGQFLEKNRFFIGIGYKMMNGNTTLQIGGINDTDYKLNSHSVKNYLQLMLIYDFTNLVKKHT